MKNLLRVALLEPNQPPMIERVEIEFLDDGNFRWKLWSEGRLIYSSVGRSADVRAMIQSTAVISQTMTKVNHEKSNEAKGRPPGERN